MQRWSSRQYAEAGVAASGQISQKLRPSSSARVLRARRSRRWFTRVTRHARSISTKASPRSRSSAAWRAASSARLRSVTSKARPTVPSSPGRSSNGNRTVTSTRSPCGVGTTSSVTASPARAARSSATRIRSTTSGGRSSEAVRPTTSSGRRPSRSATHRFAKRYRPSPPFTNTAPGAWSAISRKRSSKLGPRAARAGASPSHPSRAAPSSAPCSASSSSHDARTPERLARSTTTDLRSAPSPAARAGSRAPLEDAVACGAGAASQAGSPRRSLTSASESTRATASSSPRAGGRPIAVRARATHSRRMSSLCSSMSHASVRVVGILRPPGSGDPSRPPGSPLRGPP